MDERWIIFAVLLIMYLVPELLKRRPKEKYEYPEIPDEITPSPGNVSNIKKIGELSNQKDAYSEPTVNFPTAQTAAPSMFVDNSKQEAFWRERLNVENVINGFVFSEILKPPRACRPINSMLPYAKHKNK